MYRGFREGKKKWIHTWIPRWEYWYGLGSSNKNLSEKPASADSQACTKLSLRWMKMILLTLSIHEFYINFCNSFKFFLECVSKIEILNIFTIRSKVNTLFIIIHEKLFWQYVKKRCDAKSYIQYNLVYIPKM